MIAPAFFVALNAKKNGKPFGRFGGAAADTSGGLRGFAETETDMPRVFVWIEIEAAPGQEDETRDIFVNTIKTSHKPGVLNAQIFQDTERPGVFRSLQEWESEKAFRQHMQDADAEEGGLEQATRTLKGPPKLSILRQLG
jgi:quinol monooxygenase YgiN